MTDEEQPLSFLSWKGAISGPHSIRDIRTMLKLGKVNSLYKIQVDGEWLLLRDRLAAIDRRNLAAARESTTPLRVTASGQSTPPPPMPVNFHMGAPDSFADVAHGADTVPDDADSTSANAIATATFILSLCFFIPLLNAVTQLIAMILGHQALAKFEPDDRGKSRTMATTGLWITYVQVGFLALSMTWLAITKTPDLLTGYLIMHGHMVGIAVMAMLGSRLLSLAFKLIANQQPSFSTCFVGALLPAAINVLGVVIIQSWLAGFSSTWRPAVTSIAMLQICLFAIQLVFWLRHFKLPVAAPPSISRVAIASLCYSSVFIPVDLLYVMLCA